MPTTCKEWMENNHYDTLDSMSKYYMRAAWDAALNGIIDRIDFWLREPQSHDIRLYIKNDIATMLNEKREIETHKEKVKKIKAFTEYIRNQRL